MNIASVSRPVNRVASIVVRVHDVPVSTTDAELRFLAYRAAGESPESTFGASVIRHDDGKVTVKIHRD